jgi:hypothetical protein
MFEVSHAAYGTICVHGVSLSSEQVRKLRSNLPWDWTLRRLISTHSLRHVPDRRFL